MFSAAEFSEIIRNWRYRNLLTQHHAARQLGTSAMTISAWEREWKSPIDADKIVEYVREYSGVAYKKPLERRRGRPATNPAMPLPEFAQLLRSWRHDMGFTQRQAAQRFGVTQAAWGSWETGRCTPPNAAAILALIRSDAP